MNRFYLMLLALAASLGIKASASGYQWLPFTFTDNTQLSVAAEGLEIRYDQANLKLSSATVNETLAVAELASMRFAEAPTGISAAAADAAPVEVYSLQGVEMGCYKSAEEVRAALPSGVYIVKQSSKSMKVIF